MRIHSILVQCIIAPLLFVYIPMTAMAQGNTPQKIDFFRFQKVIGSPGDFEDTARAIRMTPDNGYVVVGRTFGFGIGNGDIYLVKLGEDGSLEFATTYGVAGLDEANAVEVTGGAGFIIAGSTRSFADPQGDASLIETDSQGNVLWSRTYGTLDAAEELHAVKQLSDGGYIAVGSTRTVGSPLADVFVVRTDAMGSPRFMGAYTAPGDDVGNAVDTTIFGGFIIAGTTTSFGAGASDAFLLGVSAMGLPLLAKTYGGTGVELGMAVQTTSDGGYVLVGSSDSFDAGEPPDVYLVKTDVFGIQQFSRTYPLPFADVGNDLMQTADGGFVIGGTTFGSVKMGLNQDALLLKTDNQGNLEFSRVYGGVLAEEGFSVRQTVQNKGYVLAGVTTSFAQEAGSLGENFYIVKTNDNGFSGCHEADPQARQMDVTSTVNTVTFTPVVMGIDIAVQQPITEPASLEADLCNELFTVR